MNKVPKLRFPEFEGEWEEKKLGDISNICDGTHQTPKYTDRGVKFVSVENINDIYKGNKYISEEEYNKNFKIKPQLNDIFMTRITAGEIGATAIVDKEEDLAYYVSVALIRPDNKKVNSYFLTKYISSKYFKRELNKRIIHVAFPKKINLGDISECSVSLSRVEEQEKIASFFSLIDKKIEKQQQKIEALQDYKKGMIQKIFSQEIRFKDENGNDHPEWKEMELNKLGDTYSGLSGKTKENFGIGDAQYIIYKNVFTNILAMSELTELVEIDNNESQNKVMKGDLLFTTSSETPNEVGMVSCWNHDIDDMYLNSFCFGYRLFDKEKYSPIFMAYLLRSEKYRKKIFILAQGSTRYNISKKELMKIMVAMPQINEQNKIVGFLLNLDRKIEKEQEKLEQLNQFKKGLLQQMFV